MKAREKFFRRYRRDKAGEMSAVDFLQWIDRLPPAEFFAIPLHSFDGKRKPARARLKTKAVSPFKPVRSDDLCKRLIGVAAFSCQGNPKAAEAIYRTIRILQLMDMLAPPGTFVNQSPAKGSGGQRG